MEVNAFDGGVRPGGLRNTTDIKLLLCYLIKYCNVPIQREPVVTAIQHCGLANYFEMNEAFIDLERRELIKQDNGIFELTEKGASVVDSIGFDLPKTVRERAVLAVLQYMEAQRRERENVVTYKPVDNGLMVNCSVGDNTNQLMNVELFIPDSGHFEKVRDNFHKNASIIYKTVIAAMLGDLDMITQSLQELYDFGLEE